MAKTDYTNPCAQDRAQPPQPRRGRTGRPHPAALGGRRSGARGPAWTRPARVAKAFEDWFSGYDQDPEAYLTRTFEEVDRL